MIVRPAVIPEANSAFSICGEYRSGAVGIARNPSAIWASTSVWLAVWSDIVRRRTFFASLRFRSPTGSIWPAGEVARWRMYPTMCSNASSK